MIRRRILLACAAVLLVGAASFVYAQGVGRKPAGPYRVVIVEDVSTRTERTDNPHLQNSTYATEALNQLHAQGYEVVSMSTNNNDRIVVILRKS